MSHPLLVLVLGALAAAAAGVPAWARYAPISFWFGLGFPLKAIRVRLTWAHIASPAGSRMKGGAGGGPSMPCRSPER